MPPAVPSVFPLGSGPMMPALLLGYELTGPAGTPEDPRWDAFRPQLPRWLVHVAQQAGGYAMRYPEALGALFRLEANAAFARVDPTHLVRGFHLMAEDPRYGLLEREYPELRALCGTWGDPYDPAALQGLNDVLGRYFRLPRPVSGYEAFVRFESADALDFVAKWRMVHVREGVHLLEDGSTVGTWSDGGAFGPDEMRLLREVAGMLGQAAEPTMFLLWENSD